jgi:hypothetical protein
VNFVRDGRRHSNGHSFGGEISPVTVEILSQVPEIRQRFQCRSL